MIAVCCAAALAGLLGCGEREARAEGGIEQVVDSAIPIEEALLRFQRDLPAPAGLSQGHPTREALVRSFVAAVERRDTAALRDMLLTRDEFAWIYYPDSHFAGPPYELPPDLVWFQMQGQSEKGARLLLDELGGAVLGYADHRCEARPEGDHVVHGYCELRRVTAAGDTLRERLFGLIVEHDAQFKFVSYANRLD